MSEFNGTNFPIGGAILALLVCFPLSFIFLPIGIIAGLLSAEAFGLYPLSVLVGSVIIVQHDDGRLLNKYTHELRSGAVGLLTAVSGGGWLRLAMGEITYQQFIRQEPFLYMSVLFLIGIVPCLIHNRMELDLYD